MKKATQLVPFKDFGESESAEVEVVINSNNDQTCDNTNHNIISNMGDEDISSKENEGKEENVIVKIK